MRFKMNPNFLFFSEVLLLISITIFVLFFNYGLPYFDIMFDIVPYLGKTRTLYSLSYEDQIVYSSYYALTMIVLIIFQILYSVNFRQFRFVFNKVSIAVYVIFLVVILSWFIGIYIDGEFMFNDIVQGLHIFALLLSGVFPTMQILLTSFLITSERGLDS